VNALLEAGDYYMILADFKDYCDTQAKVDAMYAKPMEWTKMAIHNVARVGKFSSDRTIRDYADEIWGV
jgi:starch phosphorylase